MRYVIIRDDDTNALTPVDCLERLYRPFLERDLPVNLAVIPNVATDTVRPDGQREGFLPLETKGISRTVPLDSNPELAGYLLENRGYHIAQHGYYHNYFEFDGIGRRETLRRLEQGRQIFERAGFEKPQTFVAPYDKFSSVSLREAARHFSVISTGWYELRRLPFLWWAQYGFKRIFRRPHWKVGATRLLSHPGCLLSCQRPRETMLMEVIKAVQSRYLTVLVTHWWEYFRDNRPDSVFIECLHQTASYLATAPGIKVISFDDLARGIARLD